MLQINLLPVREARLKAELREYVMQAFLVVLLVAGSIGIVQSRMRDKLENAKARVNQMDNDIRQFKPQLDQVAAFRKKKRELEKKIDVIDGLDRARSGPVRVMTELAERTPDRLWLNSMTTSGTSISLKGYSLDNELVALFLRGLNESPHFNDVDLDNTKLTSAKQGGLKLVSFLIRAVIVNAEPGAKG
jgi:type IV pilus assembly protein PilN